MKPCPHGVSWSEMCGDCAAGRTAMGYTRRVMRFAPHLDILYLSCVLAGSGLLGLIVLNVTVIALATSDGEPRSSQRKKAA